MCLDTYNQSRRAIKFYQEVKRQCPEDLVPKIYNTFELSSLFFLGKTTHSLNTLDREELGLSDPVEDTGESCEVYQRCQTENNSSKSR